MMSEITNYKQAKEAIKYIGKQIIYNPSNKPAIVNSEYIENMHVALNKLIELNSFLEFCEQHEIQLERRCNDWKQISIFKLFEAPSY